MRRMVGLVAALLLVSMIPHGASADTLAPTSQVECMEPPCGYINPIIDMRFDEKPTCGVGGALGAAVEPEDCLSIPAMGESRQLDGTFRFYWDVTSEATYPNDPTQDIEVSFSGTASNPDWIDFQIEPATFVLTTVDLFNPQNFVINDQNGATQVMFDYQIPITITFTRTGDVSEESIEVMQNRDGVLPFFIKAKSTESGDRFKEAYGIEEFRFHGETDPEIRPLLTKEAPGLGLIAVPGALALAALARRRDQA